MRDQLNKSSFEGELVKIYDKFFYSGRENVIRDTVEDIDKKMPLHNKLLADIGCGTGIYELEFVRKGANVIAVDSSKDMIDYALIHRGDEHVKYVHVNMCQEPITEFADIVVALSHVIGYQLTNMQLRNFIKNINLSMKAGGLFYFNFYHQPAVTNGSLHPQYRIVRTDDMTITRISNASVVAMENALQMDYRYIIERKAEEPFSVAISEKMRYFSVMELENALCQYGFEIVESKKFLSDDDLTELYWNGCMIVKKI